MGQVKLSSSKDRGTEEYLRKSKIEVVSRVISATESDSEESTFPFSSASAYDSVAYDRVKTRLSITKHVPTLCDWFSFSASACNFDNLD